MMHEFAVITFKTNQFNFKSLKYNFLVHPCYCYHILEIISFQLRMIGKPQWHLTILHGMNLV